MATIDDFALCIPAELMAEVKAWAAHDTTSLNAFMVDAVSEKIAALRERAWLAERGGAAGCRSLTACWQRPGPGHRGRVTTCRKAGWRLRRRADRGRRGEGTETGRRQRAPLQPRHEAGEPAPEPWPAAPGSAGPAARPPRPPRAEAAKLRVDRFVAPVLVAAALGGAVGAVLVKVFGS